jgi:hypothetical protein
MPTDFAGQDLSTLLAVRIPTPHFSTDIDNASFATGVGIHINSGALVAANRGTYIPTVTPVQSAGAFAEIFGGQLFEKIILNPLQAKLGFIITDTQFSVDVWNTFRNIGQTLDSISITGVGDLVVVNPFPLPTFYGALDDHTYLVTVPRSGAPQIASTICWNFASGIGGTCIAVTGNRVVLFSPAIDWESGATERISYLTDVLQAYSDAEQRRALRQLARRSMAFKGSGLTAREAAAMEAQIWGWQNQPFGVPWWPDVTPLLADAAAGSLTIQCDTTDRQFAVGGICAIWKDPFTFEALAVSGLTAGSITLANPTQLTWKAGATVLVMPVFLGRLQKRVSIDRLCSGIDRIDVEFSGEAQQVAPVPSISLANYRGFDVLEFPANWPSNQKRDYNRSLVTLDPGAGPISVIDKGGTAITSQPFPWLMLNHSQVTTLRAFVLARFGRFAPFWIPTWDQDLVLVQDATAADTGIKIQSEFYTRFMFPNKARRYVAMIPMDQGGNVYRQITSSVDNGDGTETLGFDSAIGKIFPAARTMVSFLIFARLDADQVEIEWLNNDLAQTTIEIAELPREVP